MNVFLIYIGRTPTDKELKEMLDESPGPLNFTMFINLFGEKLNGKLFCC